MLQGIVRGTLVFQIQASYDASWQSSQVYHHTAGALPRYERLLCSTTNTLFRLEVEPTIADQVYYQTTGESRALNCAH